MIAMDLMSQCLYQLIAPHDRQISAPGGTDFISRLAAKHLADRLGQQVVVDDQPETPGH